jgi:hypothetical protein
VVSAPLWDCGSGRECRDDKSSTGGLANGSRDCAPDDKLRVIRHSPATKVGYAFGKPTLQRKVKRNDRPTRCSQG